MKRLLKIMTVASGITCVLLGAVFLMSYYVKVSSYEKTSGKWIQNYSIGLGTNFRVGFENGGLWFYNYEHPWVGGIRHLADEKGILYKGGYAHSVYDFTWQLGREYGICQISLIGEHGEFVERERDCRLPGIYYCYFAPADYPPPQWTLLINLCYPIIFFTILPAVWIYKRVRLRMNKT